VRALVRLVRTEAPATVPYFSPEPMPLKSLSSGTLSLSSSDWIADSSASIAPASAVDSVDFDPLAPPPPSGDVAAPVALPPVAAPLTEADAAIDPTPADATADALSPPAARAATRCAARSSQPLNVRVAASVAISASTKSDRLLDIRTRRAGRRRLLETFGH